MDRLWKVLIQVIIIWKKTFKVFTDGAYYIQNLVKIGVKK